MPNGSGSTVSAPVDLAIRVEFAHAALQQLAQQHHVDLLHVKGMAFEPSWRSRGTGSDADVLVRPSHLQRLIAAMDSGPWERRSRFHTGSPFGHAQTYWHSHFGFADVHRFFPGLGRDERTFERLWVDRQSVALAGYDCPVPSSAAQALIHVLNQARNSSDPALAARVREIGSSVLGAEVADLVRELEAHVGWAAASGDLESVRGHREHDLWRAVTQHTGRVDEWRARVKAEPTVAGKLLLVLRAPLVNTEHLTNTRGQRPTMVETGREFFDRARRAGLEIWRARHGETGSRDRG